jgi:hypothetical protein
MFSNILIFVFWLFVGIIANKKNWNGKQNRLMNRGWYHSKEWMEAKTEYSQHKFFDRHSYFMNGWTLTIITSVIFCFNTYWIHD